MRLMYPVGILLLALLIGTAAGETYIFEGTTANGQYGGTLTVGSDGNMALGLAAVEDGTMSAAPVSSPEPGYDTLVSQGYTMDVTNGQGFSGVSVIGASGDKASTATLASGTHATVSQEAGIIASAPFNGVYASQTADGGTLGESGAHVYSYTTGVSSRDDIAYVMAWPNNGPFHYDQSVLAGSGSYSVMGMDFVLKNGALAKQTGDFGSQVVDNGIAEAYGSDAGNRAAWAYADVKNGSLYFDQKSIAGQLNDGTVMGAAAWQNSTAIGEWGEVWTGAVMEDKLPYSDCDLEFANTPGVTGQINASAMSTSTLSSSGPRVNSSLTEYYHAPVLGGFSMSVYAHSSSGLIMTNTRNDWDHNFHGGAEATNTGAGWILY